MKPAALAVITSLLLSGPPLVQAADYTLLRGEAWKGVKIGGEAPRTRDSICRDGYCYPLKSHRPPATAEIGRYELRNIRFETLAEVPGVTRQGDRLQLPADLGASLFQEAQENYWRSQRREAED